MSTPTPITTPPGIGHWVAYFDSDGLRCPAAVLANADTVALAPEALRDELALAPGELTLMVFSPRSDRPYRRKNIPHADDASNGERCWGPLAWDQAIWQGGPED